MLTPSGYKSFVAPSLKQRLQADNERLWKELLFAYEAFVKEGHPLGERSRIGTVQIEDPERQLDLHLIRPGVRRGLSADLEEFARVLGDWLQPHVRTVLFRYMFVLGYNHAHQQLLWLDVRPVGVDRHTAFEAACVRTEEIYRSQGFSMARVVKSSFNPYIY